MRFVALAPAAVAYLPGMKWRIVNSQQFIATPYTGQSRRKPVQHFSDPPPTVVIQELDT
jgi:hypothetical protein